MPLRNKVGKRYNPKPMAMKYADSKNEEVYGTIDKALGNCSFNVNTIAGEVKVASLSGKMKKRGRVKPGDTVLIEPLSEDLDRKHQIIFRYTNDQVKILEREGHLKSVNKENNDDDNNNSEDEFLIEGEYKPDEETKLDVDENFIDDI